jgi:hypothetical protein
LRLEVGLELKSGDLEGNGISGEGFRLGYNCSGEGVHLAMFMVCKAFMDN